MSKSIKNLRDRLQRAVSAFKEESRNNELAMIRGYIRREMKKVSYIENEYTVGEKSKQRKSDGSRGDVYSILEEILGKTKEAMNGVNILKQRICAFRDKEEEYWCMTPIPNGFRYCKDHFEVAEMK